MNTELKIMVSEKKKKDKSGLDSITSKRPKCIVIS